MLLTVSLVLAGCAPLSVSEERQLGNQLAMEMRREYPLLRDRTVELYVRDIEASVPRPVRELKGFAKIDLAPGEAKTVRFTLTPMDLSYFDVDRNDWYAEPGFFDIQVGPHSREGRTCRLQYRL